MANDDRAVPPAIAEAFARLVPEGTIGVAVSGGGDSMALLAMLHLWRSEGLYAATVNHGLRAEAADEAAMVAVFCADRGIPHQTLTLGPTPDTGNLQAALREGRYALLSAWAGAIRTDLPVLTAHTMDDQAETVLMRLARGSGAEGLSGMHPFHERNGRMWCRPLLGARRAELRDWLRSNEVPWVEDPSNDDPSFDRIKARQAFATLEPLGITVEGVAATALRLHRQSDVLRAEADRLAKSIVRSDGPEGLVADRDLLRAAHPDTAMRWLAEALMQVGGTVYRPRFRSLEPLYRRISSGEDLRATLAGCLIEAQKGEIRITPEQK